MPDGKPAINTGTGVALSVVITLSGAVWSYATTAADVRHLQGQDARQEARLDATLAAQQALALEQAAFRADVRALRDGMARIEKAVETLAPVRTSHRGTP